MINFKFDNGDKVKDKITGFTGIIVRRTQWLNNCNTYGVQPEKLKDGIPQNVQSFDEPQLKSVKKEIHKVSQRTGGPNRHVSKTTF